MLILPIRFLYFILCFGGGFLANVLSNSLHAPTEVVKQIIINIEAGVEVEVTIAA